MTDTSLEQHRGLISSDVTRGVVTVVLVGIILLMLGTAYIWFSGGDGRASVPVAAPVLTLQPDDTRTLFQILPEESEVRFRINETLLGEPKTVVGASQHVAGDLLVDFDNPGNSQLGHIRVNVRTFTTDNEFRNRALRGQILQADRAEFEFAEFAPTSLSGLPPSITTGETVSFEVTGNLSLHGVTRRLKFNLEVTLVSNNRLEGTATATVQYQDFDLTIPEAAGVANVSDDVQLEIDFTALEVTAPPDKKSG